MAVTHPKDAVKATGCTVTEVQAEGSTAPATPMDKRSSGDPGNPLSWKSGTGHSGRESLRHGFTREAVT